MYIPYLCNYVPIKNAWIRFRPISHAELWSRLNPIVVCKIPMFDGKTPHLSSGNQTWQMEWMEIPPVNGGLNGKIISEWCIFHWNVWLPAGRKQVCPAIFFFAPYWAAAGERFEHCRSLDTWPCLPDNAAADANVSFEGKIHDNCCLPGQLFCCLSKEM